MLRFGMFKTHKPRSFNLQPRYYNERKERLDKLKDKYSASKNESFDKNLYREHLHQSWRNKTPPRNNSQIFRMLAIVVILILVVYYVLDFDFIEAFNGK